MHWEPILKTPTNNVPNLVEYEPSCATFSWSQARQELDGLPGGRGLNIAQEAIDRHALGSRKDQLALRWLGKNGAVKEFTYDQLRKLTNRFANVLRQLGVHDGERVFALAGRVPELYLAALGSFKHRSVFCPLFSAFGPEPIKARMNIGSAKVLVTTEAVYQRKVTSLREQLPSLEHVLLLGEGEQATNVPGTLDFHQLMNDASEDFTIPPTDPEDIKSSTTRQRCGTCQADNSAFRWLCAWQRAADGNSRRNIRTVGKAGTRTCRASKS
jgi:acetyl-CoA synthetase